MTSFSRLLDLLSNGRPTTVWLGGGVDRRLIDGEGGARSDDTLNPVDCARLLHFSRLWVRRKKSPRLAFRGVITTFSHTLLGRYICASTGNYPLVVTNRMTDFLPPQGPAADLPKVVHAFDDQHWRRRPVTRSPKVAVHPKYIRELLDNAQVFLFGWDDSFSTEASKLLASASKLVWCSGLDDAPSPVFSTRNVDVLPGIDMLSWAEAAAEILSIAGHRTSRVFRRVGLEAPAEAYGCWLERYYRLELTRFDRTLVGNLRELAEFVSAHAAKGVGSYAQAVVHQSQIETSLNCLDDLQQGRAVQWRSWGDQEDKRLETRLSALRLQRQYEANFYLNPQNILSFGAQLYEYSLRQNASVEDKTQVREVADAVLTACADDTRYRPLLPAVRAAYCLEPLKRWELSLAGLQGKLPQDVASTFRASLEIGADSLSVQRRTEGPCARYRLASRNPTAPGFVTEVSVSRRDSEEGATADEPHPTYLASLRHGHDDADTCPVVDMAVGKLFSTSTNELARGFILLGDQVGDLVRPEPFGKPLEVLISHAPKDRDLVARLRRQFSSLERKGMVIVRSWEAVEMSGTWSFHDHLAVADLILLIVTAEYLASSIEFEPALEKASKHETEVAMVILEASTWDHLPELRHIRPIPRNATPIASAADLASALASAADEVRGICADILLGRRIEVPAPFEGRRGAPRS